jgi:AcrR family transcriptional regulator
MPTAPPRPMRADARRNHGRILRAAWEAFAEGGESAALEEIARRAGVGIGTLYHFPSRQALRQDAGVVRTDVDLSDVLQMVGGITRMPAVDRRQMEHIVRIALDGLRYRPQR